MSALFILPRDRILINTLTAYANIAGKIGPQYHLSALDESHGAPYTLNGWNIPAGTVQSPGPTQSSWIGGTTK